MAPVAPERWDYGAVAREDIHAVGIGGALVSVVDPNVGREAAYNEWYEQDHFYAGALAMPWMFAGRRFVATGELALEQRRDPVDFAVRARRCTYLHLYWVSVGHLDDHLAWTVATNNVLRATPGRIFTDRHHVFTGFHGYLGNVSTSRSPVLAHQCLDYPFDGVIVEALEPRDRRTWLERAPLDDYIARIHSASDVAHSIILGQHAGFSAPPRLRPAPDNHGWTTVLHFVSGDVRSAWRGIADAHQKESLAGVARVAFAGAFDALVPGQRDYLDALSSADNS